MHVKTIAQQINWDFKTNGFFKIYNLNGYPIYIESISGYWAKREYDSSGNEIYFEDSDGQIIDNRPISFEDKVVEIDGVKYKLSKL